MDAFDAGVLIAAAADQPLGRHVRALFEDRNGHHPEAPVGIGSMLLLPDLAQPLRMCSDAAILQLKAMLDRIDLRPLDDTTAELATALAVKYDLAAVSAVHLATAVLAGAERFLTVNMREYSRSMPEIEVVTPADLARRHRSRTAHVSRSPLKFLGARH